MRDRIEVAVAAGVIVLVAYIIAVGVLRFVGWLFADQWFLWLGLIVFPVVVGVVAFLTERGDE